MTQVQQSPAIRGVAAAAVTGTVVEWFDFAVYGALAPTLARIFFPAGDRLAALLSVFAVFAVAFALRPVGGLICGMLGDRLGRRRVLAATIVTMSAATAVIGLLPGYAAIGIWAPILLTAARCLQGLSAGGEYAGACTYLVEHSPTGRRARYASLLPAATFASFALAAAVVFGLSAGLGEPAMTAWGWRLPFLIAAPLGIVGYLIRRRLAESPAFTAVAERDTPPPRLRQVLRDQGSAMLRLGGFIMLTALSFYLFSTYMTSFLEEVVGLDKPTVLASNVAALVAATALAPVLGRLADRVGRRPVMYAAATSLLVLAVPGYLLAGQRGLAPAVVGQLLLAFGTVAANVATAVLLCELFPTRARYTASAITYNVAYALFGGTAPFVATLLVGATGSQLSPAYYLAGVAALALIATAVLPETGGRDLTSEPAPDDPADPRPPSPGPDDSRAAAGAPEPPARA